MKLKKLSESDTEDNKHYTSLFESKYGFIFEQPTYTQVPFASKDYSDAEIADRISRLESFLLNTSVIDRARSFIKRCMISDTHSHLMNMIGINHTTNGVQAAGV